MAVWEDCPDDVLGNIISRFHQVQQLAILTITCRRLRDIVAPLLEESRQFRRLSYGRLDTGRRLPIVPFRHFLKRPVLFLNCQNICLELFDAQDNRRDGLTQEVFRLSEKGSNNLEEPSIELLDSEGAHPSYLSGAHPSYLSGAQAKDGIFSVITKREELDLLERSVKDLRLREWEDGDLLLEALHKGSQDARFAVLLLMHRNMENLHVRLGGDDSWITWVIRKLVASHPLPFPSSQYGFHALREVTYSLGDGCKTGLAAPGISLHSLAPFFLLPSIKRITGVGVIAGPEEEFRWDGEYHSSAVTELIFHSSSICYRAIEELLRIPSTVDLFYYGLLGCVFANARFGNYEIFKIVTSVPPCAALNSKHCQIVKEGNP